MITLVSGSNDANIDDGSGKTVGELRSQFAAAFRIPEGASATVNGSAVSDSYELEDGDELVFTKTVAEKGR